MKNEQNLDFDILNFFNDIKNQSQADQILTLRLLLDKHIHLNKSDHLMDKIDFNEIIGNAKKIIIEKTLPIKIGKNESPISENEVLNLCVIEATIMALHKRACLKKIPKFDYKE
jgi:hypothetical protein